MEERIDRSYLDTKEKSAIRTVTLYVRYIQNELGYLAVFLIFNYLCILFDRKEPRKLARVSCY